MYAIYSILFRVKNCMHITKYYKTPGTFFYIYPRYTARLYKMKKFI